MLRNIEDPRDARELLLSLLPTSGTLAGFSLALVGIVDLKVSSTKIETVADDLFLCASLGFVVVCYLIFFALRHLHTERLQRWTGIIDILFLASLTVLIASGFTVVYLFV
jgi:hypothetical protein